MSSVPLKATLEQEINPWEAQSARFDFAARKLNLEEGLWKLLRTPAREIIVHFPVAMDDGRIEMFTGFRVQHCIARGPGKGGIRYAPNVNLDEVRRQGRRDLRSQGDEPGRAGAHDPPLYVGDHRLYRA
jgi:hypothetical protein